MTHEKVVEYFWNNFVNDREIDKKETAVGYASYGGFETKIHQIPARPGTDINIYKYFTMEELSYSGEENFQHMKTAVLFLCGKRSLYEMACYITKGEAKDKQDLEFRHTSTFHSGTTFNAGKIHITYEKPSVFIVGTSNLCIGGDESFVFLALSSTKTCLQFTHDGIGDENTGHSATSLPYK